MIKNKYCVKNKQLMEDTKQYVMLKYEEDIAVYNAMLHMKIVQFRISLFSFF